MTIEEKRENVRLRNILWRKNNPEGYLQAAEKYRNNHRDKIHDYKLKTRYNITLDQYNEMLQKQNGKCDICGCKESALHNTTKKVQRLAVDHCHITGKVRGILCQDCNRGIAKFKEDVSLFDKAKEYILKHK